MGSTRKKDEEKIRRFSNIRNDAQVPFFQYRNPKLDPITKLEKRKIKTTEYPIKKPKINMKCFKCKMRKKKDIDTTDKRFDQCYTGAVPLDVKLMKDCEERRKKEKDKFFICRKEVIRLPSPIDTAVAQSKQYLKFPSSYKDTKQTVIPEKLSLPSDEWPVEKASGELVTRIPKSRLYINRKTSEPKEPIDSTYFIYDEEYRKARSWYDMYRGSDTIQLEPFLLDEYDWNADKLMENESSAEEGEEIENKIKMTTKIREPVKQEDVETISSDNITSSLNNEISQISSSDPYDIYKGQGFADMSDDKNSVEFEAKEVKSVATSVVEETMLRQLEPLENEELIPDVVEKILQKYQDSEARIEKPVGKIKRGTITSHSASTVGKLPEKFFFGVKLGTIHYGDNVFSERSRFRQGLPMCVTAYIYSFIVPPNKWMSDDINKVLDMGDKLYLKCLDILHLHENPRILNPEDLYDTFEFCDRRIKYKIDDPDIAGFTRSEDPKVYNLVKGLNLFFNRNRSGILQTYNTNILIWKQKNYYVFDPEPRNKELFSSPEGYSLIANLYDIPSIGSMLLNRGKIENWPFIISKITIKNVQTDQSDGDSLMSDFREESLFKIVSPNKAVISGSLSISDDCFGEYKNRQSFAVSTIALVYNNVTPACSWQHRTVDKIIRVANQFFIVCQQNTNHNELRIENIPAFFTIGPLMIEIAIGGNLFSGLMYRKAHCLFNELLRKFFFTNSKAIVEIDSNALAIWRFRDVFYMFDPFSRDKNGLKIKLGTACVTMNTNIETLIETILINFPEHHSIFKLHALKMIRITRDTEFGRYPKNFEDSETCFFDTVKLADKRNFLSENITVDNSTYAIGKNESCQVIKESIVEIGSFVESLDKKLIPAIECPPPQILAKSTIIPEKIIDLDSPTLSDTQIEKELPVINRTDSYEFKLIQELYDEDQDTDDIEEDELDYLNVIDIQDNIELKPHMKKKSNLDGEELIKKMNKQKEKQSAPGSCLVVEKQVNTDLKGLILMPREILEPNHPPLQERKHIKTQKRIPDPPEITQLTELAKLSNYISLPDGSEVLYGSKNIAHLTFNYALATPFVSAVAIVMESKYTLTTWTGEVVDTILDYGFALHNTLEIAYADVPTIVIPRLTIGQDSFHVTISFLFDSLLAISILEQCLQKMVFRDLESAIIVTDHYSCAVFLKRKLYYMYDGFGCNLVGLGEGADNTGVACMFRFKSLHPLVKRFLCNKSKREYSEPTEASRFIISTVVVKPAKPPRPAIIPRKEKQLPRLKGNVPRPYFESNPMKVSNENYKVDNNEKLYIPEIRAINTVGYQRKGDYTVIEGSTVLLHRGTGNGEIKACHFIGVCAMIGIFGKPIKSWDTQRVDYVFETGKKLYGYVDRFNFADKRNITNLLFDKHFYDVIVKRVLVSDDRKVHNFKAALQQLLLRNKYLLIQFSNCCFVLYRGKKLLHLFDPYGVGDNPKACWIKFEDLKKMINYIHYCQGSQQLFFFYTINISKFKKATRKQKLNYKLRLSHVKKKKTLKRSNICFEDEDWLLVYPIPWSRMKKELPCGKTRGSRSHIWHDWDVEYPNDLYSLLSSIHQSSMEFPKRSRSKQTIANCIVAIIMTEIYNFIDWNSNIMDAILKDGNQYFLDCVKKIKKTNYEIRVEDFLKTVLVFPYSFQIDLFPLVEGTMYIVKQDQFNISKALQYFFQTHENRCGIICCMNGSRTKYVAFGRIRNKEYFMYDCSSKGPPMFLDYQLSKAYILRCLTLNRLIHIITVTLRSGDFFIYHVGISEEQPEEQLQQVTYYGEPDEVNTDSSAKDDIIENLEPIDDKMWNKENEDD